MMRQKQLYSLSVLPKHKLPTQLHKGRPLPSSPLQSWCTCSQSQNWIWMDGSSLQYRGTETNANTRTRTELHQNSILCDSITHLCKIKGYNYAFCRRDSDQYSFFFVRSTLLLRSAARNIFLSTLDPCAGNTDSPSSQSETRGRGRLN